MFAPSATTSSSGITRTSKSAEHAAGFEHREPELGSSGTVRSRFVVLGACLRPAGSGDGHAATPG